MLHSGHRCVDEADLIISYTIQDITGLFWELPGQHFRGGGPLTLIIADCVV